MKFKDLVFEPKRPNVDDSMQAVVSFPNGYGASIITGPGSYSSEEKPYELAVIGLEGNLCYTSSITDDVLGYLTKTDVTKLLTRIGRL